MSEVSIPPALLITWQVLMGVLAGFLGVTAVKRALEEANIEIPFPQRTLWFKEPLATRTVDSV